MCYPGILGKSEVKYKSSTHLFETIEALSQLVDSAASERLAMRSVVVDRETFSGLSCYWLKNSTRGIQCAPNPYSIVNTYVHIAAIIK